MFESNIKAVNNDVKALITDAQALFNEAAVLTGAQAEEVRARGMRMLDAVMLNVQEGQACALVAGKKMAASTEHYVKENPWRAIATVATVGLMIGVLLGRK